MKRFPSQFSEILTPYGLRILNGEVGAFRSLFLKSKAYFTTLENAIDKKKAAACMQLLDLQLYKYLAVEQRRIPPESITRMKKNYSETLNKTLRVKTAFFRRRDARSFRAAERIGLIDMMRSDTFIRFAEVITGFPLNRNFNMQAICYEHGNYAGPHNDHHPEYQSMRHGFIDFHIMFTNGAVAHQYLVYEEKGHFSKIVDINVQGGISVYKLPFWHYTTPLAGKTRQEAVARRWLLLGTFEILEET